MAFFPVSRWTILLLKASEYGLVITIVEISPREVQVRTTRQLPWHRGRAGSVTDVLSPDRLGRLAHRSLTPGGSVDGRNSASGSRPGALARDSVGGSYSSRPSIS